MASAQYTLASRLFRDDQTNAEGIGLLKRAAEAGYQEAMRTLGIAFFLGKGVDEDNRQARDWMRRAAALGDSHAKNNLKQFEAQVEADEAFERDLPLANAGDLPAKVRAGLYLIQSKKNATPTGVKMLTEATAAGSTEAMCALAECYLRGIGVPANRGKATELYKQAADLGSSLGKHNYEQLQEKSPR